MDNSERVVEAIVEALRDRASDGFSKSQIKCPVITGNLKRSGSVKDIWRGSELNYSAIYASTVERGQETRIEYVASHTKTPKKAAALTKKGVHLGNYSVKSYKRTISAREGKHFIESSLKEAFESFSNSLDMFLRTKFGVVSRE
jgi:hypothetical protein